MAIVDNWVTLHECPMSYLDYVLYLYWYLQWSIIHSITYYFCLGRKWEVLYAVHSLFISVFSYIFPIFWYIFSYVSPTFLKLFSYFFLLYFPIQTLEGQGYLIAKHFQNWNAQSWISYLDQFRKYWCILWLGEFVVVYQF